MRKKHNIDFVLYEDDDEKLIFRFYPRRSSCHSFGNEPPKSWKNVYKVYYSYAVLHRWKFDDDSRVIFECNCDECSVIDEVAARIKHIVNGTTVLRHKDRYGKEYDFDLLKHECCPFGMGVSWTINKFANGDYRVSMFNWDDTGYRFSLSKEELKAFGEYLTECCEYMLTHGDPI